nr:hypothetical protein Q903MT_gene1905 [Picea sitchensis]
MLCSMNNLNCWTCKELEISTGHDAPVRMPYPMKKKDFSAPPVNAAMSDLPPLLLSLMQPCLICS